MSDQQSIPEEETKRPLSVSAAMALAKGALESLVVRIVGEVSEVSVKSGYAAAYFTVKDEDASLPCMMWKKRYEATGIELQVGQLVEITGRFSLYAAKGRMNFDVFSITLGGEGDLRLRVANLARKLKAEGLTAEERKRPLPLFPERIGLVTSPRGAAVHDVLRTLRRRFPEAEVILAGVPVEGAQAANALIEGLRVVTDAGAEVVLMVRGGGSFEDFMPFNDEALARAIAANPVPVVTGIGHEVDTSIADMVSDLRASTPTAAAEAVSPSAENLTALFNARADALQSVLHRRLERTEAYLARIGDKALFQDALMLFASDAQALDSAAERLSRALPTQFASLENKQIVMGDRLNRLGATMLERFKFQIGRQAARLEDLSPLAVLSRGYAFVRTIDGTVVKTVTQVSSGEHIDVKLADGSLDCEVMGIKNN